MEPQDLTRSNVLPRLWNAIETGYDSMSYIESKKVEDLSEIVNIKTRLDDCEEASNYLISLQLQTGLVLEVEIKEEVDWSEEAEGEGTEIAKKTFGNFPDKNRPTALDMRWPGVKRIGFQSHGAVCDEDAETCSLCIT